MGKPPSLARIVAKSPVGLREPAVANRNGFWCLALVNADQLRHSDTDGTTRASEIPREILAIGRRSGRSGTSAWTIGSATGSKSGVTRTTGSSGPAAATVAAAPG